MLKLFLTQPNHTHTHKKKADGSRIFFLKLKTWFIILDWFPTLDRGGEATELQLLCAEMLDQVTRFYAIK